MNTQTKRAAWPLIKAVALLQLKLLVGAVRDLALSPITLAAAVLDLLLLKSQEPRFFRGTLRIGERTEDWIDLWSHARDADAAPRENFEALLARVEEVVRDPQTGARRARVLKRWAERQAVRAKQRATEEISTRMKAISDRKNTGDGK
ncbi:MAG: hypothetical protein ACREPT_06900 [Rudaea sp.]